MADIPAPRPEPAPELGRFEEILTELRRRGAEDPFLNPIDLLGLHLLREIQAGRLDHDDLERMIGRLTAEAFLQRAERLRDYLGELDPERNREILRGLLRGLLHENGEPVPFAEARARLERNWFGFVFTAHPTFGLAARLQRILSALALGTDEEGREIDAHRRRLLLATLRELPHRPEEVLDLDRELAQALEAIVHLQKAVRSIYQILAEELGRLYPDRWRELVPRLVTVASWVGYDLDGRADISWEQTLASRLTLQLHQLEHYRDRLARIRHEVVARGERLAVLELVEVRLALACKVTRETRDALAHARLDDPRWLDDLAAVSRELVATREVRLADRAVLVELLDRAVAAVRDRDLLRELWVLRAEVANHGLAAARTHLRLNARQLHNAIRNTIGMEHAPDDPTWRLSYLEAVERLIAEVEPVSVNFGSIVHEQATAKRAFMICAQLLKYLDGGEPIRFLIAECETAFTLLTALYLAKLFGVDDRIDISPLFETRIALERGAGIVAQALAYPAYRDYLRRRGRICIQTGFSDAGRYMGQTAASVAIERVRLALVGILAEHGLGDLEVVIFDTHGESIGRGGHPGSLRRRLEYFDTPESRRLFRRHGIFLCQETSFQGGDGYQLFLRDETALAVPCRCLEHVFEPPPEEADPFYERTTYVDEFFATVRQFNTRLVDDPCYARLLGMFGTNLLYRTGSRAEHRERERGGGPPVLEHPSQLRAIPHNAILQQLGHLVHVIGGVGRAMARDPEAFRELYAESPRFRSLMTMVEHAFKFTDPRVTAAYLSLFDAGRWLQLASSRAAEGDQEALRLVADHVEAIGVGERLARVFRFMLRDYLDLAAALRDHRRRTRDAGEQPIAVDVVTRDRLHLLHAIRLALLQALILRAIGIPDFSDRHAVTREELVQRLFRLDVEPTLELLASIFPLDEAEGGERDYGEPASYTASAQQSYAQEHETLFRPIARIYELARRIGTGVIHHLGAVG